MTTQGSHLGLATKALQLDTARERFWTSPNIANTITLLRIAVEYLDDGIIGENDFFRVIEVIAHRKREQERIEANLRKVLDP